MGQISLSSVIIVVFIMLCLLCMILFMPKKKRITTISHLTRHEAESILLQLNKYIEQYNTTSQMYHMKIMEMSKEIHRCRDYGAMEELARCVDRSKQSFDGILKDIANTKDLLEDAYSDVEVIQKNLACIKDRLADIWDEYHALDSIAYEDRCDRTMRDAKPAPAVPFSFFDGCVTKDDINKRYKQLAKAFHPDTGCGSPELFEQMTEQYHAALARME